MAFRRTVRPRRVVHIIGTGTLTGVSLGTPETSATFNSIGIKIPFTEQGGTVAATAALEFRAAGDLTWLPFGLPLDRVRLTTWGSFYSGSLLFCLANTTYNLRVTINGTGGSEVLTFNATTRAETIPDHATVLAGVTHHVRLTGNDTTGTGLIGAPWATVGKALTAAPSGAVVQVGSGAADEHFVGVSAGNTNIVGRTTPITLIAPFAAVDDNRAEINVGKRTFIEGPIRAAPTGSGTVAGMPTAPWQQVVLTGPLTGRQYTVWKWAGAAGSAKIVNLGYGSTRTGELMKLTNWRADNAMLTSVNGPGAWAELMFDLQQTFHYGFYQPEVGVFDSGTSSPDIWARLPGDANPNTFWWCGSIGVGLAITAPDSAVYGMVMRNWQSAIRISPASDRFVADHLDLRMCTSGLRCWGTVPDGYAEDPVMQYCLVRDRGNRSLAPVAGEAIVPWGFSKQYCKLSADGIFYMPPEFKKFGTAGAVLNWEYYISQRVGTWNEGTGFENSGTRRAVVRHCTFSGVFNGVGAQSTGSPTTAAPWMDEGCDVHDCIFRELADDCVEPARGAMNHRRWNNVADHCISWMSSGNPTAYGPIYDIGNLVWNTGNIGIPVNDDGTGTLQGNQEGYIYKFSSSAQMGIMPPERVYVINCTYWSADPVSHGGSDAAGQGPFPDRFYVRNTIWRVGNGLNNDMIDYWTRPEAEWNDDYNEWAIARPANSQGGGMFRVGKPAGNLRMATFALYRADSGQGVHSNRFANATTDPSLLHDVTTMDAQFTNTALLTGMTLGVSSVYRLAGIQIAGIHNGRADGNNLPGARLPHLGYSF